MDTAGAKQSWVPPVTDLCVEDREDKDGKQNRKGQEEWWGETARQAILGSLREFTGKLKSRLDYKGNRNLPRVVLSPILSPGSTLS